MSIKLGQAFDVRTVKPNDPSAFGGLPVGLVPGRFVSVEVKTNKDPQSGSHAEFTFKSEAGPTMPDCSIGMSGKYRLNLWHQTSQKAYEIAHEQLSAMGWATGVLVIDDLDKLLNIPLCAIVERQETDKRYTEIRGVCDFNGMKAGAPTVKQPVPVDPGPGSAPADTAAPAGQAWTPGGAATPVAQPGAAQPQAWGQPSSAAPAPVAAAPAPQPAPAPPAGFQPAPATVQQAAWAGVPAGAAAAPAAGAPAWVKPA